MKNSTQPVESPALNTSSSNTTFPIGSKTFTLPQMNESLFSQGVLDNVRFSRAFAKDNQQHAITKSAISAAVGHFAVRYFPNAAARVLISFNEHVSGVSGGCIMTFHVSF